MKLHELQPNWGAKRSKKRVGRGPGAGQGKTAGKGTKGQSVRQGAGGKLYRQGGNLPFFRRLPFMRGEGFTPPNRVEYNEVNVEMLERFDAGTEVNAEVLAKAGLLSKNSNPIVIQSTIFSPLLKVPPDTWSAVAFKQRYATLQ